MYLQAFNDSPKTGHGLHSGQLVAGRHQQQAGRALWARQQRPEKIGRLSKKRSIFLKLKKKKKT